MLNETPRFSRKHSKSDSDFAAVPAVTESPIAAIISISPENEIFFLDIPLIEYKDLNE